MGPSCQRGWMEYNSTIRVGRSVPFRRRLASPHTSPPIRSPPPPQTLTLASSTPMAEEPSPSPSSSCAKHHRSPDPADPAASPKRRRRHHRRRRDVDDDDESPLADADRPPAAEDVEEGEILDDAMDVDAVPDAAPVRPPPPPPPNPSLPLSFRRVWICMLIIRAILVKAWHQHTQLNCHAPFHLSRRNTFVLLQNFFNMQFSFSALIHAAHRILELCSYYLVLSNCSNFLLVIMPI